MSEEIQKPEPKVYPYDPKVSAIHRLRVNVKSLAAEAKIIRKEARRASACYANELTLHRRGRLREESRYAQLALAYLRGRTYKSVEKQSVEKKAKPVDFVKVQEKLYRAGRPPGPGAIEKWLKE